MQHLVTYGIDKQTDELRYIKDVDRGLACNCKCPYCSGDLVAYQGQKIKHHFKHRSGADCKGAFESQLHLLSKEIIEENKVLMLPEYQGRYFVVYPPYKQTFTEVVKECPQDDLQPDCLCKYQDEQGNEQTLWVEIYYSHAVDEVKAQKIRERKLSCVEIDVSRLFKDKDIVDKDILTDFLLNHSDCRHWINNPYGDRLFIKANEVRQQESIIPFLKEYSVDATLIESFKLLMFQMFVPLDFQLKRKDCAVLCEYVKEHQANYSLLDPIPLRIYVSALQILLCNLIVKGRLSYNRLWSKEKQLYQCCADRNVLQQKIHYWTTVVLRNDMSQPLSPRRTIVSRPRRYGGGRIF